VNREEKSSEQDEVLVYETMYKVIHCEKGALKSQVSLLENADTENVSKNQDIMHRWKMQVLRMQVRVRMGGKRKIENATMKLQGWTSASTEYLSIRLVLYIRVNTVCADYKINGKWLPRALESVSIASALSYHLPMPDPSPSTLTV